MAQKKRKAAANRPDKNPPARAALIPRIRIRGEVNHVPTASSETEPLPPANFQGYSSWSDNARANRALQRRSCFVTRMLHSAKRGSVHYDGVGWRNSFRIRANAEMGVSSEGVEVASDKKVSEGVRPSCERPLRRAFRAHFRRK